MATFTYEDVVPSLIANTTMRKRFIDGVHKQYLISPADGYVLHDNRCCWTGIDDVTGEETLVHEFCTGTCTCAASYDFEANPYDFYAAPKDPAGENIEEVMA